jgi:hypothetical protein
VEELHGFVTMKSVNGNRFYNIFIGIFKGRIKNAVENEMKKAIVSSVNGALNELLSKIPIMVPINDDVALNYGFVADPTFSQYVTLPAKGICKA